ELDMLGIEQARREVEALKERIEWHRKSSDATYNIIASKKARAENKVNEIRRGMENFQAKADRDGVVVYKSKWNGEKFQIGETVWSGFPVLDRSYTGKVKKMDTLVRPKAWDIPNKVLSVEIELDRLDTGIMRPAMSIRAKIETGSITDCLSVPLRAVHTTAEGATVKVRTQNGWREQAVKPGEANSTDVVITEGLKAGDQVASDYSRVK